jgi:hypothetical protein
VPVEKRIIIRRRVEIASLFFYMFQKSLFVATDIFARWALIIGSREAPVLPSVL